MQFKTHSSHQSAPRFQPVVAFDCLLELVGRQSLREKQGQITTLTMRKPSLIVRIGFWHEHVLILHCSVGVAISRHRVAFKVVLHVHCQDSLMLGVQLAA